MATRKKMTVTEVLSLLENIDDTESDGLAESDVSWSLDSSSDTDSESDSEFIICPNITELFIHSRFH